MKYDPAANRLELTARNLTALRDKLDDPESARTIVSPCRQIMVRSVEDTDRTESGAAATVTEGIVSLTRSELMQLMAGASVTVAGIEVVPVPDEAHYANRRAGDVLMPSTGELRRGAPVTVNRPGWKPRVEQLVQDLAVVDPTAVVMAVTPSATGPQIAMYRSHDPAVQAMVQAAAGDLHCTCGRCGRVEDKAITWCTECAAVQPLRHICEICGVEAVLTPDEAYAAGWDHPPRMGMFGVISPRTCPKCPMFGTVWAALACDGFTEDMLTDAQRGVVARILAEPGSLLVDEGDER